MATETETNALDLSRRQILLEPETNLYVMAVGGEEVDDSGTGTGDDANTDSTNRRRRRRGFGFLGGFFGCASLLVPSPMRNAGADGNGEGNRRRRGRRRMIIKDPRLLDIMDRLVIKKYEKVKPPPPIAEPKVLKKKKCLLVPPSKKNEEYSTDREDEEDEIDSSSIGSAALDDALKVNGERNGGTDADASRKPNEDGTRMKDTTDDKKTKRSSSSSSAPQDSKIMNPSSSSSSSLQKHHIPIKPIQQECAICWEPYKVGQKICSSPNLKCVHTFHSNCMIKWLMEHEDCPMCRSDYLYCAGRKKCELPPRVRGNGGGGNNRGGGRRNR